MASQRKILHFAGAHVFHSRLQGSKEAKGSVLRYGMKRHYIRVPSFAKS
uniref:Uncharacterized protein n=1 Tax=Arundo donax TaxID=35708 RepID=A0A0A9H6H3_ARUDO